MSVRKRPQARRSLPLQHCANAACAPSYLQRRGTPKSPRDLAQHDCICIRHGDEAYGVWRLSNGRHEETVKLGPGFSTNDGDIAIQWALDGHGIVMSGDWLFASALADGSLVRVLPDWHQPADVHAVSSARLAQSAKVRICIELLKEQMAPLLPGHGSGPSPARAKGGR